MDFTDNPKYKENIILRLTFEYAVEIVKYAEELERKRKFSIANQVLRSGTSIGANTREAQNAESKKDFIHKIKIALKEADELEYWLFLCNEIETYPSSDGLIDKLIEIKKILNKIVSSTKRNNLISNN
jgi:four helix bundle protein